MRKLALFALSFSGAVFVSEYLLSPGGSVKTAGVCLIVLLCCKFLKGKTRLALALMVSGAVIGLSLIHI